AMTPRTRLISLSHVSWMSGARLPLEAITAMAHRQGALVLVDGAQSVGAIPLDVHALGADMYT
ncbi:MAG: aminotransferase class V-fold PLP-dependent enzyme, partial [Anaerolineae bacterium]|nr:aminotransferase class V-fold PLP-dependent enzyme [Anaerolineae bacterium]